MFIVFIRAYFHLQNSFRFFSISSRNNMNYQTFNFLIIFKLIPTIKTEISIYTDGRQFN